MNTTTLSQSDQKSTSSNKTLTLTSKNFWVFYVDNKDFIDHIFNAKAAPYFGSNIDLEEMRNEVYLDLYEKDALNSWDPTKSQLHSFLTTRIHGYIQHFVRDQKASRATAQRQLFAGINIDQVGDYLPELSDTDNSEYMIKMIRIKKILTNTQWQVFQALAHGYTYGQIAEAMGCSKMTLVINVLNKLTTNQKLKTILKSSEVFA